MIRALRSSWQACKDLFDDFFLMLTLNVLWSLLCLPLLGLCWALLANGYPLEALLASLVAVVPLAPASAALCVLAYQVTQGIVGNWHQFFAAMRHYAVPSWKLLGCWQLGLLVILVDIRFYSGLGSVFGSTLTVFWLYMLALWTALLAYLLPLLVIGAEHRIWPITRQAAALLFGRPLFTLTLLAVLVALALLSVIVTPLLVFLGVSLLALITVRSTRTLLDEAEAARIAALESEQPAAELTEQGRRGQVRPRE